MELLRTVLSILAFVISLAAVVVLRRQSRGADAFPVPTLTEVEKLLHHTVNFLKMPGTVRSKTFTAAQIAAAQEQTAECFRDSLTVYVDGGKELPRFLATVQYYEHSSRGENSIIVIPRISCCGARGPEGYQYLWVLTFTPEQLTGCQAIHLDIKTPTPSPLYVNTRSFFNDAHAMRA